MNGNRENLPQTAAETGRVHRVGTVTVGLSMVAFGVLFLLNTVWGILNYEWIFALWPLILICLGLELFAANFRKDEILYDKAAVALLFLMTLFAMTMAVADQCMEYAVRYW